MERAVNKAGNVVKREAKAGHVPLITTPVYGAKKQMDTRFASHHIVAAVLIQAVAATAFAGVPVFEPAVSIDESLEADTPWSANNGASAVLTPLDTWVAAWSSKGEIVFARSLDHGLSFSPRAALNTDWQTDQGHWFDLTFEYEDTGVSLAAGSSGRLIAVWSRDLNFIELSRSDDDGITWSPPAVLYSGGRTPLISTDGAGTWIIVWTNGAYNAASNEVYFTRSTNDGATWSPPKQLTTTAPPFDASFSYPTAVAFSGGVWVVTWTNSSGAYDGELDTSADADVIVSRSIDGGATWSPGSAADAAATSDSSWEEAPRLASDGSGNWLLAWTSKPAYDAATSDVMVARSSDGAATWSTPERISDGAGTLQNSGVRIAAGSAGTYVAVWTTLLPVPDDGYSADTDVMTSTSLDGGATWSPVQALNAASTDTIEDSDWNAFIAHDPAGHWLAFWSSDDPRVHGPNTGADIVMSLGDFSCGNGVLDPGETCDDGDRGRSDCCDRLCALQPAGKVCAADAELCTIERCDDAGTCQHLPQPAGTLCQTDGELCTFDRCDSDANCQHVVEPRANCRVSLAPGASKLKMKSDGSEIVWKWSKGEQTSFSELGQAVQQWTYALCIFDGNGFVTRIDAPLGEPCESDTNECWQFLHGGPGGIAYSDKDGGPNGLSRLIVKSGPDNKVRASLQAKGPKVEFPGLPLTSFPIVAQLVNAEGVCWEATYSEASKDSDTAFSAESD